MFFRYFIFLLAVIAVLRADDGGDEAEVDGDHYEDNARKAGSLPHQRRQNNIFKTTQSSHDADDQDNFQSPNSNEWNASFHEHEDASIVYGAYDHTTPNIAKLFGNLTGGSLLTQTDVTTLPSSRARKTTPPFSENTDFMMLPNNETIPYTTPWPGKDYTTHADRNYLYLIAQEMYGDIMVQIRTIYNIVKMYTESFGFDVGAIVALLQLRYRLQMELWREMLTLEERWGHKPRTKIWPLAWTNPNLAYSDKHRERASGYYFVIYDFVHEIEKDIEKLVDMLLDIPRTDMSLKTLTVKMDADTTVRQRLSTRKWKMPVKSAGPRSTRKTRLRRFMLRSKEEEHHKSRVREQYLLRKLGMNDSLHTPKPRFIRGWPVEETWDNLDYGNQQ